MTAPLRIAVFGATGRMGRSVIRCIAAAPERFQLGAALVRPGHPEAGRDAGAQAGTHELGVPLTVDVTSALGAGGVAVDFTLPAATPAVLEACIAGRLPLVLGTTGLEPGLLRRLDAAAGQIPLVYARNFSVGVALLAELSQLAARVLGTDYDAEIIEAHHRHKIDAPSGTALALGEAVAQGRGSELTALAEYARHGACGPREPGRIGFSVVRAGGIVGDHTVLFGAEEERLELTHRALDRGAFARGALRAALWVADRPAGRYAMPDVLGLRSGLQ